MNKLLWKYVAVLAMFPYCVLAQTSAPAQTPLTWEQVRQRFEQSNPTLQAGQIGIDESKAQEAVQRIQAAYEIGDGSPTEIPHLLREVINE